MSNILGCPVVDRVTGFKGIVVGFVEYLTGCNQALVVPPVDEKGLMREGQWIDAQRLQLSEGEVVKLDNSKSPGFDIPPPRNY